MKKLLIAFLLWIGMSQSFFVSPSVASAKEGSPPEASTKELSVGAAEDELFFQDDLEQRKIEFLLREVEQTKGAKFWRNGTAYTTAQAVDYLRMKMKWNDRGRPIKSAKDFIARIASKSSINGRPYLIQLEDGRKIEMKIFLDQKLSEWKD